MRSHLLLFTLLLAAQSLQSQARVSGRVVEPGGGATPSPAPEAYVLARAGSPERVVAQTQTDAQGRYTLTGLPQGRVTLLVQAPGFYTIRSGDLEAASIARSCPAQGDCPETSFEIARAAVIEGWLTDSHGDPYQDAWLELRPEGPQDAGAMGRAPGTKPAASDDRGYFRMWDVRPGRYELTMRVQPMGPGGPPVELDKQTIEIAPGQTRHEARLTVRTDSDVFSISGEIVGGADLERAGVSLHPAGEGIRNFGFRHEMLREGKFMVTGVRKGEYILRLAKFGQDGRKWSYLDKLNVDRNLSGLRLTPKPPMGVRGRVDFVDAPQTRLFFSVGPPGLPGFSPDSVEAAPPDFEFTHEALAPGDYELFLRQRGLYLVEPARFTVAVGEVREIVLRVSNQFASIRGEARLAAGEERRAAAHFTVGLRGSRGKHKMQADDAGGFVFPEVVPGEYEIAAWEAPDVDIEDDDAWRRAGEGRKRIVLEAGFETEIGLTVAR